MSDMETLINDHVNQKDIAEYIYERLYNRFLKIFDFSCDHKDKYDRNGKIEEKNVFLEEYKNGFLMMTSCSLLIETLASFIVGQNETPRGESTDMFNMVFEYAETKNNALKVFKKKKDFYKKIRCGLLHQGETYGKYKISRKGIVLLDYETIDAALFFKHLKALLENYRDDLTTGKWDSTEWDACRMKIRYIIENSK